MSFPLPLGFTVLASMLIALVAGKPAIEALRRWKVGQSIRAEGPQSHHAKSGTPTMGGGIIVGAALVTALGQAAIQGALSLDLVAVSAVILAYALIGWIDDYLIIRRHKNQGLSARQKLGAQILVACAFAGYLAWSHHGTSVLLPVTHRLWDLGPLYYLLVVVVMASATNAVNLTDGLDGLAAGTMAIAMGALAWLLSQYAAFSSLPGIELLVLAFVGSCLAFLWYNGHPAQVFMGDTGSLALGAAIATCAVMGRLELFVVVLGGVFVAETVSVILQVASYKTTRKRIFKMAPLHHHFELSGWPETKVVQRFYLIGGLLALITIGWL